MTWGHLSYVSMCHDCLAAGKIATSHEWVVYSVPKKHPLAQVNLLNFGFWTVIEIWSFAIGAVKEVHIVRTKCFQVGIHCFINSFKCKHGGKNAFVHSVIFSKSGS